MISVAGEYTLAVAAPSPVTSDRQHAAYLEVLSHLLDQDDRSEEEEKYVGLLTTLIHAYEQEHHSIPEATPIGVLRALIESNGLRQKDSRSCIWLRKYRLGNPQRKSQAKS